MNANAGLTGGFHTPPAGFNPAPLQTTINNISSFGDRGATFSISADGTKNPIIWGLGNHNLKDGTGTVLTDGLLAFDANNFTAPLFSSGSGSSSLISAGNGTAGVKFSLPTVANGLVHAGTGGTSTSNAAVGLGSIVAYGLLNPNLDVPTNLAGSSVNTTTNHLTWVDNSSNESFFQVERSPDGSSGWTVIGYAPSGATSFDDTDANSTIPLFYRVKAINGPSSGSYSTTAGVN